MKKRVTDNNLSRQSKDHWQIGNGQCESPGTY